MQRIILHIDMNSYFASCEQQANPFLRGQPVGVCAYLSPNGCIIASSIEAKARGVKTGCRVTEAKRLCPEIILVQNEPAKYRSTTDRIFSILAEYTDRLEPYSIDEAFLDLTGWVARGEPRPEGRVTNFAAARATGETIARRIRQEVGEWLRCSIGISYTHFLAKLVSDNGAKGSVGVLSPTDLGVYLETLSLTDAWGIAKRIEARLNTLGITTLNELRTYPITNLLSVLGKPGYYLWANVNGIEVEGVHHTRGPKTIGHSYCLPRRLPFSAYHRGIVAKLAEKTGRRLRSHSLEARSVFCYWHYPGAGDGGGRRLGRPIASTDDIFQSIWRVIDERAVRSLPLTMIALGVGALVPVSGQQTLFTDTVNRRVAAALDLVNDKFGEYTVIRGSQIGTDRNAPDRVGYRKTVEPVFTEVGAVTAVAGLSE